MFVLSKRNIIIPGPDGSAPVRLARGQMCTVPDRVAKSGYFQALVKDGKIVVTGRSDREAQAAAEKPVKVRRGRETSGEG